MQNFLGRVNGAVTIRPAMSIIIFSKAYRTRLMRAPYAKKHLTPQTREI